MNSQKMLTANEQKELLSGLKLEDSLRTAFIEVLYYTGARRNEVLNLTLSTVNFEDNSIFITGLKGSRDRELPLPEKLVNRLKKHCYQLYPTSKLFPWKESKAQAIWKYFQPVNKAMRSMRHSFGVRTYQKTLDIRLTQLALGHKDIGNTMIYMDYVYTLDKLREVLL